MKKIIPKPQSVKTAIGHTTINDKSVIYISKELGEIADTLKEEFPILQKAYFIDDEKQNADIYFKYNNLDNEAYMLKINDNGIQIEANAYAGAFYALQSLKQMLFFRLTGQ